MGSEVIVVGSGPNGLAAAIRLAEAGYPVRVVERAPAPGGGCRSIPGELPGFRHDWCASAFPLAVASRFFRDRLADLPVPWLQPPIEFAHPFDDGTAVAMFRSPEATADQFGPDRERYLDLMLPLLEGGFPLVDDLLGGIGWPDDPVRFARVGLLAIQPAERLLRRHLAGERARALFAGSAAHAMLPFDRAGSAAPGLVLQLAGHLGGWPLVTGGGGVITDALVALLERLGGQVETGVEVRDLRDLGDPAAVMLDLTVPALLRLEGAAFPRPWRAILERFQPGPAAFKVGYELDAPIPWQAEECRRAGTVHLGGTWEEIAAAEEAVGRGRAPVRPFVLVGQPSLFDPTAAPAGAHTAWAYCHLPYGSSLDMTARIEAQLERFAPGFSRHVLARHVTTPSDLAQANPNFTGGDISGGASNLRQLLARPVPGRDPWHIPGGTNWVCSSSTPPGAGVHGLCGLQAAESLLRYRG